jgi:hypothetical protein
MPFEADSADRIDFGQLQLDSSKVAPAAQYATFLRQGNIQAATIVAQKQLQAAAEQEVYMRQMAEEQWARHTQQQQQQQQQQVCMRDAVCN